MNNNKFLNPVLAALTAAIIAVCSQISFVLPSGIPLTLQTLGVTFCGYFLGVKWGIAAITVYLLSGLTGIPVFSSFGAGFYQFAGPSGGFLVGFIPLILFCGLSLKPKNKSVSFFLSSAGFVIFWFLGTVWYSVITKTPLFLSFTSVVVLFIPKDILCAFTAFFAAFKIKRKICGFNS